MHPPPDGFQTVQGARSRLRRSGSNVGKVSESACRWCVSIACTRRAGTVPALYLPYLHHNRTIPAVPAPYPLYLCHTRRACTTPAVLSLYLPYLGAGT